MPGDLGLNSPMPPRTVFTQFAQFYGSGLPSPMIVSVFYKLVSGFRFRVYTVSIHLSREILISYSKTKTYIMFFKIFNILKNWNNLKDVLKIVFDNWNSLRHYFSTNFCYSIVLHPSYGTSDLPARGFSAASSCCWSEIL